MERGLVAVVNLRLADRGSVTGGVPGHLRYFTANASPVNARICRDPCAHAEIRIAQEGHRSPPRPATPVAEVQLNSNRVSWHPMRTCLESLCGEWVGPAVPPGHMLDGGGPAGLGSPTVWMCGDGPPGGFRRRWEVAMLIVRAPQRCGRVADKSGPYRVSPEGCAPMPEAESDWTRSPPPVDAHGFGLRSTSTDPTAAMARSERTCRWPVKTSHMR